MSPEYMLFDEVTSALGPQRVGEVLDTLRMLASEGMAMICVIHQMKFAREVSDRHVNLLVPPKDPRAQMAGSSWSPPTPRRCRART